MSTVICKGTTLKLTISTVMTPLSQVLSIDAGDMETETFESDTLENGSPGIPYTNTGRTEPGNVSGELFFDPSLASHIAYLGFISSPPTSPVAGKIVFSNAQLMAFSAVGFGLGVAVALKEGLKGKFKMKLSGLPTFSAGAS
jgi:hypothetical protein